MLKTELRKIYLEKRKALSHDEVLLFSEQIFKQFLLYFSLKQVQHVHVFLPIKKFNEIETRFFIEYFWDKGVSVYVPKVVNGKIISLPYTPETTLIENSWGILEPEGNQSSDVTFDIVLTPLLYADTKGNRIGYGKGFYDAFFTSLPYKPVKIGLSFFKPKEQIEDVSKDDIQLNYLVTPEETLSFDLTSISTK